MRIIIPGETDTAVGLDAEVADLAGGIGAVGLGHRHRLIGARVVHRHRPRGVVGRGARVLPGGRVRRASRSPARSDG